MIKLWGRVSSINVQKVLWCLNEIGCRYERVDAGGKYGVVQTAEYARLNPNRLVPTIEDEGFILWESNAIVRYLCSKYSSGALYPEALTARADADRWMDWQTSEFTPPMRDPFLQLVRTPANERKQELIDAAMPHCERRVAILEAHLATREYVAGADFTMGDIVIGCTVHRWFGLPAEKVPRPHMRVWYERVMRRPGPRNVLTLPLE